MLMLSPSSRAETRPTRSGCLVLIRSLTNHRHGPAPTDINRNYAATSKPVWVSYIQ